MVDLHSDEGCYVEPNVDNTRTNYADFGSLEVHNFAWIIAGACVAVSCVLSLYLMYKHLRNYTKPEHQRHIVRIVLMVPIYGIDSFLSFRFYWLSVYFDVIRDCYEAFVIYTFYSLLIEYVGGYEQGKEIFSKRDAFKLAFPLCCIQIQPKRGLIRQCKRLTLQYVIIRPAMTILAITLHSVRTYCPGNYSPEHGYLYITIVNFLSVTTAMYALVLFYSVSKVEIAKYKPIPKFVSVKLVIFLSFWQSIIVSAFVTIHGLKPTTHWSTDNIATGVQNALLCVEMLLAALLHIKAYSYHDFETDNKTSIFTSAGEAFNPYDIALDVYHSFFPNSLRKKKSKISNAYGDLEEESFELQVTTEQPEDEENVIEV